MKYFRNLPCFSHFWQRPHLSIFVVVIAFIYLDRLGNRLPSKLVMQSGKHEVVLRVWAGVNGSNMKNILFLINFRSYKSYLTYVRSFDIQLSNIWVVDLCAAAVEVIRLLRNSLAYFHLNSFP